MKKKATPFIFITLLFLILPGFFMTSCTRKPKAVETVASQFVVRDFNPLSNWHYDTTGEETKREFINKSIFLDYTNAFRAGFIIPTINQVGEGRFVFSFSIKNTGPQSRKFFYKILYQNESYKFHERDEIDSTKQNMYAPENFYGSWEDTGKTFAETGMIPSDNEFHQVSEGFRIVGNPRNEKRFFGEWGNDRWKRNPRVGKYSFLLIVTTEENLLPNSIPMYIKNISLLNNNAFVNPYFYFLYGDGKKLNNCIAQKSPFYLKVIAKPDPGAGIYINPNFFTAETSGKYFCKTCGQDTNLFRNAPFQQFMNYIDPTTKMNNIPVIADVLKDNYSRMDYNWNRSFYRKEELIGITATTTKAPCTTLKSDPETHTITMWNPKAEFGKWEKQNVGIETRHGFTYGKWTVKAKLTELLNKNNLWNGLTNAIWLITQEQSDWNTRRDCNKEGYLANYYGGQTDKRVKNVSYSEIDFEILKTVPYCPSYLLPPAYNNAIGDQNNIDKWNVPFPEEIIADDDKIEVACTNWDMACWQPEKFDDGCRSLSYLGKTFWMHRWDKNYRALTEKTPEPDDELFGSPYYYFQIDWEPTEIIWRIGPSKDKLRVVGYVNEMVTSIPNNQMFLIITQEFHNTKWWIGSPYSQDNIPFPKNDIVGEIFEITIE
ncbi:MAG: hypothetical protein NTX61_15580 [Bacteroidetes bacterium]|nr:hypothetical protein [Bacteroidota bacterium]